MNRFHFKILISFLVHHGKFISHDTLLHLKYVIDMNCHLPQEIYCSLYNMSHQGSEYYSCSSKGTAINHNNVTISRVLHNKNETDFKDINGLSIHNQNFTNFPKNLHVFFPGLMAIQIVNCGLRNLTFDDVKYYKKESLVIEKKQEILAQISRISNLINLFKLNTIEIYKDFHHNETHFDM